MTKSRLMGAACAALLASMAIATQASANDYIWFGPTDFDDIGIAQNFAGVQADTLNFSGFGFAHSHGDLVNFSVQLELNGVATSVYNQDLNGGAAQNLGAIGPISFASSIVTGIGFGCTDCSFNTFHGMGEEGFSLTQNGPVGGAPEPTSWAIMLAGFGGIGAVLRQRRSAIAAAA